MSASVKTEVDDTSCMTCAPCRFSRLKGGVSKRTLLYGHNIFYHQQKEHGLKKNSPCWEIVKAARRCPSTFHPVSVFICKQNNGKSTLQWVYDCFFKILFRCWNVNSLRRGRGEMRVQWRHLLQKKNGLRVCLRHIIGEKVTTDKQTVF